MGDRLMNEPAFPHADFEKCPEHDHAVQTYAGMSKREFMAMNMAKALVGALMKPDVELESKDIGIAAVQLADGVLESLAAM